MGLTSGSGYGHNNYFVAKIEQLRRTYVLSLHFFVPLQSLLKAGDFKIK